MLTLILIVSSLTFANENKSYNTSLPSKKNMIGMPIKLYTTVELKDKEQIYDINIISKYDYHLDTIFIYKDTIIQVITVWEDHGNYISPDIMVYLSKKDILLDSIYVKGIKFFVDSTNLVLNNIKDNKGLRNINNESYKKYATYIFIIIFCLIIILIASNKDKIHKNKFITKNTYKYDDAKKDIEKLDLSNSNSDIIKNYINLSVILRKYISSKFFIKTEKMTSKEIFYFFEKNIHDREIINKLKKLFNGIDIIKYSNDFSNIINKEEILILLHQIKNYKNK